MKVKQNCTADLRNKRKLQMVGRPRKSSGPKVRRAGGHLHFQSVSCSFISFPKCFLYAPFLSGAPRPAPGAPIRTYPIPPPASQPPPDASSAAPRPPPIDRPGTRHPRHTQHPNPKQNKIPHVSTKIEDFKIWISATMHQQI